MPNIFREGTTKMKPTVFIAASSAALSGFLGTGLAQATTIPSTISSTLTITTDSHLTGNVACTVTGAPCIKFGANGIKLKLNGFIITGNGGRNSCTLNFTDTGIDTNLKNNVSIQGPGLVSDWRSFVGGGRRHNKHLRRGHSSVWQLQRSGRE